MIHFRKYCFFIFSALICLIFIPSHVNVHAEDLSENIPEKYSLCDPAVRLVSDIGDQGEYNTCWAYSALGSIQTQLKKKG